MPICLVSGGKDSQATAIWCLKNDVKPFFLFCDTEWEDIVTYEFIKEFEKKLGTEIIRLKSIGFEKLALKKKRFPSKKGKFCTEEFKVKSMIDFILEQKANITIYQGIRWEESTNRAGMRPDTTSADPEEFLIRLRFWLEKLAERLEPGLQEEPLRLLHAGEYRAGVIAAISLLETTLRKRVVISGSSLSSRSLGLRNLLEHALTQEIIRDIPVQTLLEWSQTRNEIVHTQRSISKAKAEQIVKGVLSVVSRIL